MRFSVIVPLYNKAPYVKRALESIMDQSFRDFELIVVDDGSTDDSYSAAQEILKDTIIPYQLIGQENAGVSTAKNNGATASSGDYLCFLDADDWWDPTYLEKMDELIQYYPDSGIYGANYYYVKNGNERICVSSASTGYINYCKVYAKGLKMPLWTGAVCLPRHIFKEFNGFKSNLSLGEDFDLWIRIALKYKVAFLDEPIAYYYQDSDPTWRLVGKLRDPATHILWNLDYLSKEEKTNPDYKALIDGLRTYSLLPYYLSPQYRDAARQELAKVDWHKQSLKTRLLYRMPVSLLRLRDSLRKAGSFVKQGLVKRTKKFRVKQ